LKSSHKSTLHRKLNFLLDYDLRPPVSEHRKRSFGAPPPLIFRVREAKSKTRAQKRAAGTKKHALFDK
jgi:hypothetical protein